LAAQSPSCERALGQQCEGNEGFAGLAGLGKQLGFELVRDRHFAGGDFPFGGAVEAEFATGEGFVFGGTRGRSEDAAGHGSPGIDIAEASGRIEGGTGRIVSEVVEAGLVFVGCPEETGVAIAGEIRTVGGEPVARAVLDGLGCCRACGMQCLHPGAEAESIERVDGEGAMAALGATGATGEPGTGTLGGLGEGRVQDVDQLAVAHLDLVRIAGRGCHPARIAEFG